MDKYTYKPLCCAAHIYHAKKKAPPRAQNGLPVDENPKQGLVGGCPAPLHSCRVKGEFYNDKKRIYTTRSFRASYIITLFLHHCTCAVLSVSCSTRSLYLVFM